MNSDQTTASVSMCSLRAGEGRFGIETRDVHEVLGEIDVCPVALAPHFVGGVVPYRGEVLLVLCFRRLLGLAPLQGPASVLVLRDKQEGELFGLAVDAVEDVLELSAAEFEPNPCTLDARQKALFAGAYKAREGLVVHIDPEMLRPARLMAMVAEGVLGSGAGGAICAH